MQRNSGTNVSNARTSALSILHGEHVAYATALKNLSNQLDRARTHSSRQSLDIVDTGLRFIDTFIDHFHHPKEDEFLFRALRRRTNEADYVLRDLQFEHAYAGQVLAELKSALNLAKGGDPAQIAHLAELMERHMNAQFAHMECEESVIFPLAQRVLNEADWRDIDRAFRANRDPLFSVQTSHKFGALFRTSGV